MAFSVERSRISAVGGRDPKVGSGVGEWVRGPGGGTGGYCLLGDLSSNTSRQAASSGQRGRTRGFLTPYPRGGQPPALVEIKNSLYYTSHSAPSSAHLFDRFHPRSFCTASLLFAITSSSAVVPPHAYSFSPLFAPPLIIFRRSGGASFARTDLIWGRLYLMERILLKFACTRNRWNIVDHPLPLPSIPFVPLGFPVDLSVLTMEGLGIVYSPFLFADNFHLTCVGPSNADWFTKRMVLLSTKKFSYQILK